MFKVFKKGSANVTYDYIIVGNHFNNDYFESIYVEFVKKENCIYLTYKFMSDRVLENLDDDYDLESVYDRVTDAMIHIKYELNLRDKLDQEDNQ